jgi:hypothetical protein
VPMLCERCIGAAKRCGAHQFCTAVKASLDATMLCKRLAFVSYAALCTCFPKVDKALIAGPLVTRAACA